MSEFKEYIASTKFNIGQDKETNLVVEKGDPVLYDGTVAKIGGEEYNLPRLKSAISAKWLITPEELGLGASFSPKSAGINMRAPTPQGEARVASSATMADEEQEVSTLSDFRAGRQTAVSSAMDGEEVEGVKFATKAGEASKAEGTRVDTLSQNAIHRMEEGSERTDKAEYFAEVERRKMEREIAELRAQLGGNKPQIREGIKFENEGVSHMAADTTSSDSPEGVWDGSDAQVVGTTAKVQAESTPVDMADKEDRLAFARQVLPTFDWDFSTHWKTKLKTLQDNSSPVFVSMVYAVESEAMKKHIASAFPDFNLG